MMEFGRIIAEFERRPDEPFALATLVRARGSSYRRPGARMLIDRGRLTIGALSGGCLEEEVAVRAQEVIATGVPTLLTFDTRLRYGCNGAIEIFVERVAPEFLAGIAESMRARRSCCVATIFAGQPSLGSRLISQPNELEVDALVQTILPPLRLISIGEGPESAALRRFGQTLGWEMIETDDASTLPDEFDSRTAVIVKTHNYGRDFAALHKLLPLSLRYVALIGPRRRRDQLLHALADAGIETRSEFFAPAGLNLGAETPEEIALAMVAEIQAVFAGAAGEFLRERDAPIHLVRELAVA